MNANSRPDTRAGPQAQAAGRWHPFSGFDPYLPDHLNTRHFGPARKPAVQTETTLPKATQTADRPDREFPGVESLSVNPEVGSQQYMRHRRQLAPAVALPTQNPKADLPDTMPSYEAIYHLFGYGSEPDKHKVEHLTHGSAA